MKLHENQDLFKDAILSASRPVEYGGLGIGQLFIEKDYWICRSLKLMSERDSGEGVVLKGGTSLTKAYGIVLAATKKVLAVLLLKKLLCCY